MSKPSRAAVFTSEQRQRGGVGGNDEVVAIEQQRRHGMGHEQRIALVGRKREVSQIFFCELRHKTV